jgi:tRNA (guanine37-N1)-methyltransferase
VLPEEIIPFLYRSYDIIGDIAVLRVPRNLERYSKIIAETIMAVHKNVNSVWQQHGPVSGDFRLRELKWISGRKTSETIHKEYGCFFKVDISKCYFSPRLSYERMRIAKLVNRKEIIINMFSGVGCFSIIIAKHSPVEKVYSIDINPVVISYMQENIQLNKVEGKVIPLMGDSKEIVENKLHNIADRVIMPLPEKAYEYFESALKALKNEGGFIHYYDFVHAKKSEDPLSKVKEKISQKLRVLNIPLKVEFGRVVRTTGPNWYQVVLDILIDRKINIATNQP